MPCLSAKLLLAEFLDTQLCESGCSFVICCILSQGSLETTSLTLRGGKACVYYILSKLGFVEFYWYVFENPLLLLILEWEGEPMFILHFSAVYRIDKLFSFVVLLKISHVFKFGIALLFRSVNHCPLLATFAWDQKKTWHA